MRDSEPPAPTGPQSFPTLSHEDSRSGTGVNVETAIATHLSDQTSYLTLSSRENEADAFMPGPPFQSPRSLPPWQTSIPRGDGDNAQLYPPGVENNSRPWSTGASKPESATGLFSFGEAGGCATFPMSPYPSPAPKETHYARFPPLGVLTPASPPSYLHQGVSRGLPDLPNELLFKIFGYLDICDLLATSRTSHHLRDISIAPILHTLRLRQTRATLSPMLYSPSRPTLADLIARSIFLTHTTVVSRRLARSFVSIRLSRRLAARPSAEVLAQRSVLPPECVPGRGVAPVAPALVARKRAVERERVKDGLRRWVERVWRGEVRERSEGVRKWDEKAGVGRVWKLRRFWERVSRGEQEVGMD